MANSNSFDAIVEAVSGVSDIVVATHVFPDPDAIGSSFGLTTALRAVGKNATVYLGAKVPGPMQPLVDGVPVTSEVPADEFPLLIVVDTANRARICGDGEALIAKAERVINIDHHYSNEGWADINHIDDTKAASAEIVLELLPLLNVQIDLKIAELLFAGLSDDTGSFRFSNTKAETFRSAAALLEYGVDAAAVAEQLYFSVPYRVIKLRGEAIQRLTMELDGRVAMIVLDREALEKVNALPEDVEGIVDEARSVEGPPIAVLLRQLDSDWKVSLRSKRSDLDVSTVASVFNGGGHRGAAGCRVDGSAREAADKILAEVKKLLDAASV